MENNQEANKETTTVGVWLAKKNWRVLPVRNASGQEEQLKRILVVDTGEDKENVQPAKKIQLAVRSGNYPKDFFDKLRKEREESQRRPKRTAGVKCQLMLQDLVAADLL